jgi:peptidoglycan hydrolase-like protein with peptidoglycan-binding domain
MVRGRRVLGLAIASVLAVAGLTVVAPTPASAAYPVPPTPSGLTAAIEDLQPYIGQSLCDPVAKPGVTAFRNLLMATYTDSGSLGIVRDCGAGGQSEHKEGRALDWKVSAYNARQKGEADTVLAWLLKTDQYGNKYAMARRFGIMYMIWNKRIWKAYNPDAGWQAYSGESPHTDHVHFSFGWNGAKKVTSYWDRTVAPVDFGLTSPPHVTPVRRFSNLETVRKYGATTLKTGSTGSLVSLIQKNLLVKVVDGDFGPTTAAHVARFQYDQKLPITQKFGPAEWKALFPPPTNPFGSIDKPLNAFGNLLVRGWAIDGETTQPIQVRAYVGGAPVSTVTALGFRDDVRTNFPEYTAWHGYDFVLPALDPGQEVCVIALNATGTLGYNTNLGCSTVEPAHDPIGGLDSVTSSMGVVSVTGWALDPDGTDPVSTSLTVDGQPVDLTMGTAQRDDIGSRFPGAGNDHGVTAELVLSEGTHQVCLLAANLAGTLGVDSALGCLDVKVAHTPVGGLDVVRRAPGGVLVQGWGLDPDTADAVDVQLTDGATVVRTVSATTTKSSLASSYPDHGTAHGFSAVLDLATGSHSVCATVLNAAGTDGANTKSLGCKTVTVSHDPVGAALAARTVPGGAVRVTGAAYDPDTLSPARVQVLVDKVLRTTVTADDAETARWAGYGTARAFTASLTGLSTGWHAVCLRVLNADGTPGASAAPVCTSLVVHSPVGRITSLTRSARYVNVYGWALDPDTTRATSVRVYVDGRWRVTVSATGSRSYLSTVMPGYGTGHGFSKTVALTAGSHKVCVLALNVSGTAGANRTVACATVSVP